MFEHIIGNERVKKYLTRMVEHKRISNSFLFAGPEGVGKSLFAHAFAKLLICSEDPTGNHLHKIESGNHPDIRIYRPEGKVGMHSIASLRQLTSEVYQAPYEAKWKVFIIHDADRMLTYSANALLKTFEEPLPSSIIILISSSPSSLLPTVLSRCQAVYFSALSEEDRTKIPKNNESGQCKLKEVLLSLFAKGPLPTYKQLHEFATNFGNQMEEIKSHIESEVRSSFSQVMGPHELTAMQKQGLEKEVEGVVSMHLAHEIHKIFDIILGWYRDMSLLHVNGNRTYLMHPDYVLDCEQALQRGEMLSIEVVQKAIADARLSFERSTSIPICLENLFLKLNLLRS